MSMATVEYDLDTTGGIMEEIQKLIAPPSSEDFNRRTRRRDRGYRRQGRAVNHDCCDSCKEGGDLLCCDRCPAAFHLQCHDPPLEEEELPSGEWICHRCRVTPQPEVTEQDGAASSSSSQPIPGPKPSTSRSRGRRRSQEEPMEVQEKIDEELSSNPLKMLAKAARLMNPVQFDLPKEVACTTTLPGSSKRRLGREGARGPSKKLAHELDNGMVPLPAKLCFVCNRSCKRAPLIQCDYCPLLFHMDCLDPPLTSMPSGRWMCPNHAENCLDEGLLKSTSLTERVKLWDHYTSNQVNQHSVKVEFLKKIHRQNPMFRIKVKHPKRTSVTVPRVIKDNYSNPPELLPQPCQHSAGEKGDKSKKSTTTSACSLEDQEEWLTSVVSLQTSIAKYLAQKQLNKSPSAAVSSLSSSACAELSRNLESGKPTTSLPSQISTDNSEDVKERIEPSCVSGGCAASPPPSQGVNKDNFSDGERTKVNGPLVSEVGYDSPDSMSVPNGPVSETLKTGAVSLLNHTPNGDIVSRHPPDSISVKTSSNSLDSGSMNVVKVPWPPGDKTSSSSSLSSNTTSTISKEKNIVISAINKANNTVITKVVSSAVSQSGKSQMHTASLKGIGSSLSPTSILNPRTSQSIIKSSTIGASVNSVPVSSSISANKLITVSTQSQGNRYVNTSSSNNNTLHQTKASSVSSFSHSTANISTLNASLQSCIEGNGETELNKLDERLVQILAWQRLQQLLPSKPSTTQSTAPPVKKGVLNGLLAQDSSEVQARALLCPLTGKGHPVPMPYRSLSIGTGADMEVCLNTFGTCNYVSAKHAVIFFDETSKHFELLNYSEHGTTVDNVLYSCDFTEKVVVTPETCPIVSAVRGVIKKGRKKKVEKVEKTEERERVTMSCSAFKEQKSCSCRGSSSSLIGGSGAGWEGTALLHHGSYIKVGCLQFVFSIVEHAPLEPKPLDRRRESVSLLRPQFRTQKSEH